MIDIVLIHTSKSEKFTLDCVDSIKKNTTIPYKIIVVNGDKQDPFIYNASLNKGAELGHNPYILFCNNDLLFDKNWDTELMKGMKSNNLRSASPYCTRTHINWWKHVIPADISIGYTVGKHFAGWCFCWERSLWEELGLDTTYEFWCSDNVTVDDLIKYDIKHGLIKKSIVNHCYSKSLNTVKDDELKTRWTHGQLRKYLEHTGDESGLKDLIEQENIIKRRRTPLTISPSKKRVSVATPTIRKIVNDDIDSPSKVNKLQTNKDKSTTKYRRRRK